MHYGKSRSIFDYTIENNIIVYQTAKKIMGFICIEIFNYDIIMHLEKMILEINKNINYLIINNLKKNKLLFFITIQKLDKENFDFVCSEIMNTIDILKNNLKIKLLTNNLLIDKFFFFHNYDKIKNLKINFQNKNKYLILFNREKMKENYIHKIKLGQNFHRNSKFQNFLIFIKSMKISPYLIFGKKKLNSSSFISSLLLISEKKNDYKKVENYIETSSLNGQLINSKIFLKDLKYLIIKNPLKNSNSFELKLIKESFPFASNPNEYNHDLILNNIIQIINIYNSNGNRTQNYTVMKTPQIQLLYQDEINLQEIKKFLSLYYSKSFISIILIKNQRDYNDLILNSQIEKLKKVVILQTRDIDIEKKILKCF